MSKWTGDFAVDLGERVLTTALYGLITMLTADQSGAISGSPQQWWLIVGLPSALALIKGLLANLKDPDSGASLVNHPPGPAVDGGYADVLYIVGAGILLLAFILFVTTLLKVFVVDLPLLIVAAIVGVVLVLLARRGTGRVV